MKKYWNLSHLAALVICLQRGQGWHKLLSKYIYRGESTLPVGFWTCFFFFPLHKRCKCLRKELSSGTKKKHLITSRYLLRRWFPSGIWTSPSTPFPTAALGSRAQAPNPKSLTASSRRRTRRSISPTRAAVPPTSSPRLPADGCWASGHRPRRHRLADAALGKRADGEQVRDANACLPLRGDPRHGAIPVDALPRGTPVPPRPRVLLLGPFWCHGCGTGRTSSFCKVPRSARPPARREGIPTCPFHYLAKGCKWRLLQQRSLSSALVVAGKAHPFILRTKANSKGSLISQSFSQCLPSPYLICGGFLTESSL